MFSLFFSSHLFLTLRLRFPPPFPVPTPGVIPHINKKLLTKKTFPGAGKTPQM